MSDNMRIDELRWNSVYEMSISTGSSAVRTTPIQSTVEIPEIHPFSYYFDLAMAKYPKLNPQWPYVNPDRILNAGKAYRNQISQYMNSAGYDDAGYSAMYNAAGLNIDEYA